MFGMLDKLYYKKSKMRHLLVKATSLQTISFREFADQVSPSSAPPTKLKEKVIDLDFLEANGDVVLVTEKKWSKSG